MPAASETERWMREYVAAWNDHDPPAIAQFLAPECEQYTRAGLRKIAEVWFAGFPDLSHEIEELLAGEEWVLARLTLRGTHDGAFQGVPATGREIAVADHVSTRFDAGQIVEHHATADFRALFEQLDAPASAPTLRANEALVRQYFEALNDRDRAAFTETLAPGFTYGDVEGPATMAEREWEWLEAMDLTWTIEDLYAGRDFVTTRLTVTGTHQGEILGLEPTGESFEISALTLSLIADGEITEWYGQWEFTRLLDQIGVIDAPGYEA